jgi:hypothetical protein
MRLCALWFQGYSARKSHGVGRVGVRSELTELEEVENDADYALKIVLSGVVLLIHPHRTARGLAALRTGVAAITCIC